MVFTGPLLVPLMDTIYPPPLSLVTRFTSLAFAAASKKSVNPLCPKSVSSNVEFFRRINCLTIPAETGRGSSRWMTFIVSTNIAKASCERSGFGDVEVFASSVDSSSRCERLRRLS